MIKWLWDILLKIWHWGLHDRPRLAQRVSGDETRSQETTVRTTGEWSQKPIPVVAPWRNARGLEEDEGDQGSGTTGLSVVDEGVGAEHQEVLDYSMKEHFFSPLNPNNR